MSKIKNAQRTLKASFGLENKNMKPLKKNDVLIKKSVSFWDLEIERCWYWFVVHWAWFNHAQKKWHIFLMPLGSFMKSENIKNHWAF